MNDVSPSAMERLRALSVPTLNAVMFKKGLRTRFLVGLSAANPGLPRLCGPAFTLRAIPAREDIADDIAAGRRPNLHRQALERAPPGSVVVVATGGEAPVAALGDVIATALIARGVAGVVSDGGASDWSQLAGMSLPVFARGSLPTPAARSLMFVDTDLPVGCAGVAIFPGDVIVGDADGAVCVPRDFAESVATAGEEQDLLEAFLLERVRRDGKLDGVYPPGPAVLAEYEAWRARRAKG